MYTATGVMDRQQMVDRYLPLVRRMAHHLIAKLPASVQLDDLIQAGLIGLMDAIGRFEEGQGAQFETYATQRIRGSMLDELRQNDWLPRGLRQSQRRIEVALQKTEQTLGRPPTENEMAQAMGLPLDEYQALLFEARGTQLIYYEDYEDEDGNATGFLDRQMKDDDSDPLSSLNDDRFKQALIQAIEVLPEREKLVMGLYYEQELNFREIAAVLTVTESRVCQLHSQAIARLRVKMKEW